MVDLTSAKKSDTALYAKFFHGMLERGFMLPPAQFEAAFVSMAHTLEDVQGFVAAAKEVLTQLKDVPPVLEPRTRGARPCRGRAPLDKTGPA